MSGGSSSTRQRGNHVKCSKCAFLTTKVEFLGHVIDQDGLHTSDTKVQAILNAPQPQYEQQLRSFLGLVNYYGILLCQKWTKGKLPLVHF